MDESEIPIEIHTSKLLDWLISRRHIQRDWQSKVVVIREKINEAIKDMPEHKEITILLSGSYINYFHCQKLVEILKETEANSKNLFGQYSSKRMKDWLEIIKAYTKDNVYLGEVASLLLRNINYEVPALKKQITKGINATNEYVRKEAEYEKLAESNIKEFNTSCKLLCITGKKIRKELLEKTKDFPEMNKKLAEETKCLKEAVEFYQEMVNSLLNNDDNILKMVRYIIEHGDTTVFEWKYKKPPSSIETVKLDVEDEEVTGNDDVIDFGTDENVNEEGNIDWGISTEYSGAVAVENDDTVAKGDEARTILGHPPTRNVFCNELLELEAFLKIRLYELKNESDSFSSSLTSDSLQMFSNNTLEEMLEKVQAILTSLKNSTSMHYLNITANPRYVYQLSEKLQQKMNGAEKFLSSRDFVRSQRDEILKETASLKPKVELLIKKTKELQDLIEVEISKKYNGRPVNLIAGANLL